MWIDRYPLGVDTEADPRRAAEADEVIYRLVFTRLAVAGLPDQLTVGTVEVHFIVGPIRTQVTESRQRAGLPFVFDKHMRRGVEVGSNELLTVCELRTAPVPTDFADFHARVRTHMPFDADPSKLERFDAVLGGHEQWIRVVGADDDQRAALRFWAMAAVRALDVEIDDLTVAVDTGGELAGGAEIATNQERILLAPDFAAPEDEAQAVRLAFFLCHFLASMQVMRVGVISEGFGALLIDLAGAWASYREWVVTEEMPSEFLQRAQVSDDDLQSLGAHLGLALAGDAQAIEDIDTWLADESGDQDLRELVRRLMSELQGAESFADLLAFIEEIAAAARELPDDRPE